MLVGSIVGTMSVSVGNVLSVDATAAGGALEASPELAITAPAAANSNSSRNSRPTSDANLLRGWIEGLS